MRIELTADEVVVRLSRADRIAALRRDDVRIPRAGIREAVAVDAPAAPRLAAYGLRAPGWRFRCTSMDGTQFWALDRGRPAVRIAFDGPGRLREVTVSADDAHALATDLRGGAPAPQQGW